MGWCLGQGRGTFDAIGVFDDSFLERYIEVCPHDYPGGRAEVFCQQVKSGFLHMN